MASRTSPISPLDVSVVLHHIGTDVHAVGRRLMIHNNGHTLPNLLDLLAGGAGNTSKNMARTATVETETPRQKRKYTARKRVASNGNGRTTRVARPRQPPAPPDQFGFRTGSLKSQAAAMYASKKGATLAEVRAALNSSQFNVLHELEERRGITIERTQVDGTGPRKVTRYRIVTK